MKQTLKQFNIYSADCKPVAFSVGDSRNIEFTSSCIMYRFYDIDENHALVLYSIVKTAFESGSGFFGKVADAVEAYCKACHIEQPWGSQVYR